jgi:hypothetical protein
MAGAHINSATGLATDYLNHFNEAIMLLEMVAGCPDCREDLRAWRPIGYREHFRQSRFAGREFAIAAYDTADPVARDMLDALSATMTTVIEHARKSLATEANERISGDVAARAAGWLRLLVAQAGAVINGQRGVAADDAPQIAVDRVMRLIR